jgi:predicted transcriptional regulator
MQRVFAVFAALMLSSTIVAAQQPGTVSPTRPGEMSGRNQMSMAMMDSLNQRLDSLVARMNRTSGNQKVQAMAAVINELVAQRKSMQMRMHQMMDRAAMGRMANDSTPTSSKPTVGNESAPTDTNHAAHHPSQ